MIPVIKRVALAKSAKAAQLHFKNSFRKQGFTDATHKKWKRRKSSTRNPILEGDQKRLKKSIQIRRIGANSALIATRGIKYAAIHNEGGTTHPRVTEKMRGFAWHRFAETRNPMWKRIALTEKSRLDVPIPKREFMGKSKVLDRATCRIIAREFNKLFR